ncbi:septum site-determining protein MinC [Cocleimonas sp. KMM 6892]|uniref:septum site-determining protein MinC n=1 Tax=unclassified Cocleimonas TaxID=2639732 RepID=UPI002DBD0F13|nr:MULTISPECIES: septum site-determining protein MinC [unclassified Cocleimonas]MEB8434541.1 septum site-determining protein MinC [Cocleimonas sp. KMM 6892]MEC4717434.1 septum site-determining protein MinC [Cocleimonas sp. KMM 6895]MEC4746772.1 septum site-determining protein MinC [Cocleimonas sp. KMM 6896]
MKLKGEMSMLNVLHVQELDLEKLCAELEQKRDEAPQFFMKSPIIVDCADLGDAAEQLDFSLLRQKLLELGFIPVGIRNNPVEMNARLVDAGWAIMRESRPSTASTEVSGDVSAETNQQAEVAQQDQPQAAPQAAPVGIKSLTIDRPVRSGQQVYAADADMTVLAQTSAGSEIMADGSIHVYGPLRGRVLAGARGNEQARIFCQSLQAELIAIAGRYQLLDESDTELKGKPAMIRLDGEKLIIEPLAH